MRPRAERQPGDDAAGDPPGALALRRADRIILDQKERQHEDHGEHIGEGETRLQPVERR